MSNCRRHVCTHFELTVILSSPIGWSLHYTAIYIYDVCVVVLNLWLICMCVCVSERGICLYLAEGRDCILQPVTKKMHFIELLKVFLRYFLRALLMG